MDETKLYDIYLRAYIAMRSRQMVSEGEDLHHHENDGHGRFKHVPFSGKELAAFAIGVSDGTAPNTFPRPKDDFLKQLSRLGA